MKLVWVVRGFMAVQATLFIAAGSMHFGLFLDEYAYRAAGLAESIIAAVLVLGLALTWASPYWARRAAIAAQSFGLLGVCVGLMTIVIGVGPRTALDLTIHGAMLVALVAGLIVTLQRKFAGALT